MITTDITRTVLFDPLVLDVNELYIVSGYATPTMLSWYIKNLYHKTRTPIKISLLVGMVPFDGLSVSVHEGFVQLIRDDKPQEIQKLECSYIYDDPAVHSSLFIWAKDGVPQRAFAGSAYFVQSSFVGHHQQETMELCNPKEAMRYYESLIGRSIYAQHAEIEEYVQIHPTHPVLDRENTLLEGINTAQARYETVALSLVTSE